MKKGQFYFSLTFNNLYCPLSSSFPSPEPAALLIFLQAGSTLKPSSCLISLPSINSRKKTNKPTNPKGSKGTKQKETPWEAAALDAGARLAPPELTANPASLQLPASPRGISLAALVVFHHRAGTKGAGDAGGHPTLWMWHFPRRGGELLPAHRRQKEKLMVLQLPQPLSLGKENALEHPHSNAQRNLFQV